VQQNLGIIVKSGKRILYTPKLMNMNIRM